MTNESGKSGRVPWSTRRAFIGAIAGSSTACGFDASVVASSRNSIGASQSAVEGSAARLWPLWRAARHKTIAACRKQQRLEKELVREVGFREAIAALSVIEPSDGMGINQERYRPIGVHCEAAHEIQPGVDALREQRARSDDESRTLGYIAALDDQDAARLEEASLADQLLAGRAYSLLDIVAKLDVLIALDPWVGGGDESPWPELRRIREDLTAMVAESRV